MTFTAMDWNLGGADADADRDTFNTMTANLWTPEQVSLADDAEDIHGLKDAEQIALSRVFAGLSAIESLQAGSATRSLSSGAERDCTGTRQAVLTAIAFAESMHTKAYSALIAVLDNASDNTDSTNASNNAPVNSTDSAAHTGRANDSTQSPFAWVQQNESMQEKLRLLNDVYATAPNSTDNAADLSINPAVDSTQSKDTSADSSSITSPTEIATPNVSASDSADAHACNSSRDSSPAADLGALKRLAAAVLAEALLAESGFYLPMWLSSRGSMTKSADIIRLINRDIVASGSYLGAVYQQKLEIFDDITRESMRQYVYDLANNLYFAEEDYSYELPYGDLGLEDDIEKFLSYNANKALSYLGYPALFPAEISQPNPAVTDELNDMESLASALKPASLFGGSGISFGSTASASATTRTPSSSTATSTGATSANKAEETSDDDWDF
ncbi:ribonucleotide-diphosphate reductase subunit beta [Bifidobacterium sp. ESL0798]|uniref:ribonucleotide-diphosphate reductase subunit beta n=1 Tax=Bifidobacterium sp. ESL0798 TaxID=2983235 RepID=UPI0023F96704|nr:ribonucleotide-diphosphate reductase subunit beta [Bifidobacterium sp. ESL0798]WEV74110.1 ribonucleotide-diphosphate reductase subunit beta [Bifidobacterium sp. ESL0798]